MNLQNWPAKISILTFSILFLSISWLGAPAAYAKPFEWLLPIAAADRKTWHGVKLTRIGLFGLERKARPGIPAHLHTGTDIKRPKDNYNSIFGISVAKTLGRLPAG
jgi:hypothetical protein